MSIEGDVKTDWAAAVRARQLSEDWMAEFQLACKAHDWAKAENAQLNAVAALDAYCNYLAAGYLRAEYR